MFDSNKIGYCTNVHAGVSLQEVKTNLEQHALPIRANVFPDQQMNIGLWLCHSACQEVLNGGQAEAFAEWLSERALYPYTFNAFPFHNFHQPVVKHNVYLPTWAEKERLQYTLSIAKLQSTLLRDGDFGTISTLPLGWPNDTSDGFLRSCGENLLECVRGLIKIRESTSRHIFLCIEPEPGCHFDTCEKLVAFFERYLLSSSDVDAEIVRQFVGVCHDVCHSAVMFEPQDLALRTYREAGIHVGKMQISSAIQADFVSCNEQSRQSQMEALSEFAEERYLHQTSIRKDESGTTLHEDLSTLLPGIDEPAGTWRVHFHVPIYLEQVGPLQTTNNEIAECVKCFEPHHDLPTHLEVETYAWNVLPAEHKLSSSSLSDGISRELEYLKLLLECDQ